MTAIMMASMGAAAVTTPVLDTTVTVGNDIWFSDGTDADYVGFGFNDANSDPLNLITIGSISDNTYVDGSATTRTISHVLYSDHTGGIAAALEDSIFFGLVGTSIPDTDATFREIVYNGQTYVRADADDYQPSEGGVVTYWQWQYVAPDGPTSGVRDFAVIL